MNVPLKKVKRDSRLLYNFLLSHSHLSRTTHCDPSHLGINSLTCFLIMIQHFTLEVNSLTFFLQKLGPVAESEAEIEI
jgi:hypothetical protein